ncbi:hypothetical protein D6C77_01400 [Aureobasidium pullulans]|nr:hypothetical protein D6C77_01400 [Aureobasidium pullulans]
MSPTLSLLGISFLTPVTALATNIFENRASCSTFDTDGRSYTRPGPSPFTISAGIVCTGRSPCDIPVGGFVTVDRFLNISSLDDGTVSDIFALISSSDISITFKESMTNNNSSTTQRFENGTAGYVIFTPTLRCISGTLGGCPSGNAAVTDGSIVEACTPTGSPQDPDDIVGSIDIVKADEATAEALTCNPANTVGMLDDLFCMPEFLLDYEENGPWAYDEWDMPKREAYFYARSSLNHEIELDVYDKLVDMQGIHIPTLFADVRLSPQHVVMQQDEGLTEYTEIRAILMEYISGFPLHDIVKETPESDWASICNQAVDIMRKIAEYNFINFDIKTRNILVRRGERESSYQMFYLDFGECRFRDHSDSDEVWRERKRQKDEEGAVGYMMMNAISFAKGKKGKKYKGTLPLPWQYEPSGRFDGEYIELYGNVE